MKRHILIVVGCLLFHVFTAFAQKEKEVIIEIEDLNTETFADVSCEQFDYVFTKTKEKVIFNQKADCDKLYSFMLGFKKLSDQKSFDVRGKITFLVSGKETTYCFDKFAVFFSNGKYFRNILLLRFIVKRIFDDDLQYLDKIN